MNRDSRKSWQKWFEKTRQTFVKIAKNHSKDEASNRSLHGVS